MTFIRAKEIPPGSGNWYDYEVKTIHEGVHVRQKVIKYLGRSGGHSYLSGNQVLTSQPREATLKTDSTPIADTTRIPKMKTQASLIASALGMYYGGMALDGIQQQFKQDHNLDMSESNYWNWVKRFTKEAIRQSKDFHPVVGDTFVADETYMKLGKRNVYFWDIIDTRTRFLLASHVSFTRSARDARELMKLAHDRAGKTPKTVITDKLRAYISGIEDEYGAETKHRRGGPFDVENSTGMIERFHSTLEQRTGVFRKYKDIRDIRLLTNGWLINYNYFKHNEGIGDIPPAQCLSPSVPFKDWNDVVRVGDTDYRVTRHPRKTSKVVDVSLKSLTLESA